MTDQITKEDIKALVQSIFDEKEEVGVREAAEKALIEAHDTINSLTESIEAKDSEIGELQAKVTELSDAGGCDHASEIEALNGKLEEATNRAEEAEKNLEDLKHMSVASDRAKELVSDGLAGSYEKAFESVVGMSDEEYSSYKSRLLELRDTLVENLKKLAEASDEEDTPAGEGEDVSSIPAADVSEGKETAAVSSELSSESVHEKYQAMGEALAERQKRAE